MSYLRRADVIISSKKTTFSNNQHKNIRKQSSENENRDFSEVLLQQLVKKKTR